MLIRKTNAEEERRKARCLEQLTQDRQALVTRWPFIGGIILRMELVPVRDDRLQTAATDNDRIFVDIDFYNGLDRAERLFVLAHEVWHSALMHFARKGTRDRERFNIAADLEIHFVLKEEKMREPWVLPHDPKWAGLSAEEIYERLPQTPPDRGSDKGKDGEGGFDRHIYDGDDANESEPGDPTDTSSGDGGKDDAKDDSQTSGNGEKDDAKDKSGNGGKDDEKDKSGNGGKDDAKDKSGNGEKDDAKDKSQTSGKGEKDDAKDDSRTSGGGQDDFVVDDDYAPKVAGNATEKIRGRVVAAAQQLERTCGKLPAHLTRLVENLQRPELPWREMLRQFVSACYGGKRRWLPPARRHLWQDLYLPGMREERLNAVVALDTSGSTQQDMTTFVSELVSLMRSFGRYELTVIQCDATIQKVDRYSDTKPIDLGKPWETCGGGGTDFRPVFKHIAENRLKPDVLVFFTDGFGPAPDRAPGYPVLWLLTSGGKRPSSWGRIACFKGGNHAKR